MTIREAGAKEIEKMQVYFVPPFIEEECKRCHETQELRCGVCFVCQFHCETDMIEVWEIDNPAHRWPYQWSSGHDVVKKALNG